MPLQRSDQWIREWRLLYAVIVAGKSAKFADAAMGKLSDLIFSHNLYSNPIDLIGVLANTNTLGSFLRQARVGNYTKVEKCFRHLAIAKPNLETCTPAELEKIHGIGPKTSRFFIMWIRPHERYAALDVHILRWLRERGHDAPKSTPTGEKYAKLEKIFIQYADDMGLTPRELDSQIWDAASKYSGSVQ